MEVGVQGLHLSVESFYCCAGLCGGEENLLTIYLVSSHPWRIGTPAAPRAQLSHRVGNSGPGLAGDKRQRHLDGGTSARSIDY